GIPPLGPPQPGPVNGGRPWAGWGLAEAEVWNPGVERYGGASGPGQGHVNPSRPAVLSTNGKDQSVTKDLPVVTSPGTEERGRWLSVTRLMIPIPPDTTDTKHRQTGIVPGRARLVDHCRVAVTMRGKVTDFPSQVNRKNRHSFPQLVLSSPSRCPPTDKGERQVRAGRLISHQKTIQLSNCAEGRYVQVKVMARFGRNRRFPLASRAMR